MHFEKTNLYHIYNQGNNGQKIFFDQKNYLFFLRKIKIHILPYADILSWCLMPNHFHLMIYVNQLEAEFKVAASGSATQSRAPTITRVDSFQKSIGIMLASYTRAINKQNRIKGSLFRQKTKAECLNHINGITPSFYNTNSGTKIHIDNPEEQYPQICFNYIHENPVRAKLVKNMTDWEYSSAKDYAGLRNGTLINKEKASEYVDF